MLHTCLCTICFVFRYTSWHFYAFSGTNLLTRCHSASSLFSAIFMFQKSYTEIFSELDKTKPESPIFPGHKMKTEGEPEGDQGAATPRAGTPLDHARGWCGPPGCPLTQPLRLYKAFRLQTVNQSAFFPEKFRSATAVEEQFWGTEVSVPAPYRDGEVPSEPSPSTPSPPPPSPSTSPPSPSTLMSPMVRRE
jgi:hypothetical protein